MKRSEEWWKSAVIYHIYPRSFQDSDNDGIGDLNGIRNRLGYLKWLGVDAFWLSPVYPSPMADFGYDVSNHCDIDPMFGTLNDMDLLIEEAHRKELRLILDFVPNHTSDQHPWFMESKSSRTNSKRDWYYWKDPADDGGPPNNWISRFDGESAWEWDEGTGQYYLHTFLEEQPDLNWRNPEVKNAMLDVLRFWYDRGVDGFRVDVSYRVMKDPDFRDNPVNPNWKPGMDRSFRLIEKHTKNTPDIHMFNRWIRETNDEYDNRVTIGEMNLTVPELAAHYGTAQQPEFHLPFNFRLVFSDWEADNIKTLIKQFEATLPEHGWPNWVLSNHDQPRFASRAGLEQSRNGLLFLLTAKGTPTLYYGDELGMENVAIPTDQVQDPWEILSSGLSLGRDPERTPMQWDSSTHAGFCSESQKPWLPVGPNRDQVNVETEKQHPASTLRFAQHIIKLRKENAALSIGDLILLSTNNPILAYIRKSGNHQCVIVMNISDQVHEIDLAEAIDKSECEDISTEDLSVMISTEMDNSTTYDTETDKLSLRPNEGIIFG